MSGATLSRAVGMQCVSAHLARCERRSPAGALTCRFGAIVSLKFLTANASSRSLPLLQLASRTCCLL